MRRAVIFIAMASAVTACGASIGSGPSNGPTLPPNTSTMAPTTTLAPTSGGISVGELGVIVPPNETGEYPPDLIVTCGEFGEFPLSALDHIEPLAEADPGGVAEAIAPFLAGEEGQFWPQDGWKVLHQTDAEALLVVKSEGLLTFMQVTNDGSGWRWAGSSAGADECPLEFVYPESVNAVDWVLDPSGPPLTEESTEIAVMLTERPCVDGRRIGDRLLPPEIVMTDTQVFMAFAAERPPGDVFTCPGNPDTSYVVELPAPMGDRVLMPGVKLGIDLTDYIEGT